MDIFTIVDMQILQRSLFFLQKYKGFGIMRNGIWICFCFPFLLFIQLYFELHKPNIIMCTSKHLYDDNNHLLSLLELMLYIFRTTRSIYIHVIYISSRLGFFTAYPSWAPGLTSGFYWVRVPHLFSFLCCVCGFFFLVCFRRVSCASNVVSVSDCSFFFLTFIWNMARLPMQ